MFITRSNCSTETDDLVDDRVSILPICHTLQTKIYGEHSRIKRKEPRIEHKSNLVGFEYALVRGGWRTSDDRRRHPSPVATREPFFVKRHATLALAQFW